MNEKMYGTAPLTARLEPWMEELVGNPTLCKELIDAHGSPVNVHEYGAMGRNVSELRTAAVAHQIDFQIYFARKANKTLGAIDRAVREGCGVDVASLNELRQCLDRGVPADRIIVSAAVKPKALLHLAITSGVTISLDNEDELRDSIALADDKGGQLTVALRLAIDHPAIPPTRFGLPASRWLQILSDAEPGSAIEVAGIHFHLNGYDAHARSLGIHEALHVIEQLRIMGHEPSFVDMGGGIPMSYLDSAEQWKDFWARLALLPDDDESLTWKSDRLGASGGIPGSAVYPYYQGLIRGAWLEQVLAYVPEPGSKAIGSALLDAQIQLRCEPGRSLMDGCGLTLSEVAFKKKRSDGVPLVGLHMNRTQCRSTSADFLLDPVLVHAAPSNRKRTFDSAFLVGAYCIEEELLLRRRFEFPAGVAAGDLIAFPNTAGYLMHIVESASHQLPLAANVLWDGYEWVADDIDQMRL
ncbi:diaminopimelate decarboxylase [Arthrobacter livingstonensis]|uniref:Diaminopimelate decarboxylase n=1 Tax=Arthrobacter livingstonensis TaxID=670078 RepID=A0A2V5KZC2_9MICC|nr:alanine racemase [Arthrobacter livingstonensis]PYI64231.1 diaminopimelate decarboxylase [Arthrobacter livingstonensis]